MELKKIKISENRYNGAYGEGSIFENSITIFMTKDIFKNNVDSITKDKITSAFFRRMFVDKKLNFVAIEIPSPKIENVNEFLDTINKILVEDNKIIKEQSFDLAEYLTKLTITINDSEIEYEIAKDSELGKKIITLSGLDVVSSKTNEEVIKAIDL